MLAGSVSDLQCYDVPCEGTVVTSAKMQAVTRRRKGAHGSSRAPASSSLKAKDEDGTAKASPRLPGQLSATPGGEHGGCV